jgi:hypothetical protein
VGYLTLLSLLLPVDATLFMVLTLAPAHRGAMRRWRPYVAFNLLLLAVLLIAYVRILSESSL